MALKSTAKTIVHLDQIMTRKNRAALPDSLTAWFDVYLDLIVRGVRTPEITDKIELHLERFITFFEARYSHDHISVCLQRDVLSFRDDYLAEECAFAPATVNNHLASLSKCCTWIAAQAPQLFPTSNPCSRVKELPLPPQAPHTLSDEQILLMKSLWDRLPNKHEKKGRRYQTTRRKTNGTLQAHGHARPYRDRAILYLLLATGLRREELVNLDLDQLVIGTTSDKRARSAITVEQLRNARSAQLVQVKGKGRTLRNLFVSAEARTALADYLERERLLDVAEERHLPRALFLRAATIRRARAEYENAGVWGGCRRSTISSSASRDGITLNYAKMIRAGSTNSTRTSCAIPMDAGWPRRPKTMNLNCSGVWGISRKSIFSSIHSQQMRSHLDTLRSSKESKTQ